MKYLNLILCLCLPYFVPAQIFKGLPTGKERIESSRKDFEREVLQLVNKERKKRKLKALLWNTQLAYAARYHAKDMATDEYFDHSTKDRLPNGRHKTICDVFERLDKFSEARIFSSAENIAAGENTPKQVMKSWMSSKLHKRNILDKEAKYIGIGYVEIRGSYYEDYWVQCFGL
ncbi:MAG: CAP domain-containing protein [Saprospiraceae bacterium]|nr:CAP domain-containing protein [Saprospiraceae bacterium]